MMSMVFAQVMYFIVKHSALLVLEVCGGTLHHYEKSIKSTTARCLVFETDVLSLASLYPFALHVAFHL
jgi:hypothetical protein